MFEFQFHHFFNTLMLDSLLKKKKDVKESYKFKKDNRALLLTWGMSEGTFAVKMSF